METRSALYSRTAMEHTLKQIILLSICLAFASQTQAAVYVGDNLRIGIRTEPGNQTAPITVIDSGTKLDPLETNNKYTKIRTSTGIEGWVRSSYLSETPPAKILLREVEANYQAARQEMLSMQKKLAAANHNNQQLAHKVKLLDNELDELHQQLSTLKPNRFRNWILILAAAVTLSGLAFTLGIHWYKQQLAKKLGGQSL